jgi:DNA-binding transcriptional regulator YiaG
MKLYRYTESGLDNVVIEGMAPCINDHGEQVFCIENPVGLHRAIATAIVDHAKGMSGKELRFLRTEMGMTQAELAQLVHRDSQSIGRWEKGQNPIEGTAETVIRTLAIQRLELHVSATSIEALSQKCVPTAELQRIVIDGHDPEHYRAKAA